jgi:hypothetical protein
MKRTPCAPLDSVEKMLLGAAPGDPIALTAAPAGATPDPRAARLDLVRKFLADMPELRAELGKSITAASRNGGGKRGDFLKAFAERRAQVVSLAELGQLRQQAPQAMADFQGELSRYLTEMEGGSG